MGLENLDDIELQCKIKKTISLLEEISKMTELKDLDQEVLLAKYDDIHHMNDGSFGTYYRLLLTNKGIKERRQNTSPGKLSDPQDQTINKPSEFERIVSIYNITPHEAKKLYSILKS